MEDNAGAGAVRVATLNLWGRRGSGTGAGARSPGASPDCRPTWLVAFQEAIVGSGYDQATDILGEGYHLAHQANRELGRGGDIEDGQGISVASRWPLGEVWEPDLNVTPRTEDFACGAVVAEVLAPEPIGPLLFANNALRGKLGELFFHALR